MNKPALSSTLPSSVSRRHFLSVGAATAVASAAIAQDEPQTATTEKKSGIVVPRSENRILLAPKLGMIPDKLDGRPLSLVDRLSMAGDAGFDGVDFDQAGAYTLEEAREAVEKSGVFVHNAINHAHWNQRLTSSNAEERATSRKNIEHCIRLSHAAGGTGVLIVLGSAKDGPAEEIEERCRAEVKTLLPLAAALGQPILFENVWNQMFYDHDAPPEQSPEKFIKFVDSFNSPWVGMYYDIGNHWKYGQPGDWLRAFGHRAVKLDVKGFSRKDNNFTDIGEGDLPWADVRKALEEINYSGWATAEVGGGDLPRLTKVREQMQKAFGI
ncbi:MAG: sugar phosphate isomerase/epimerase family protein [Verrucomicrobiales bacterium]